jgi:hypothetical protein
MIPVAPLCLPAWLTIMLVLAVHPGQGATYWQAWGEYEVYVRTWTALSNQQKVDALGFIVKLFMPILGVPLDWEKGW